MGILKYKVYQEQRQGLPTSGKWYAKAVQDRTIEFDDFIDHMSHHHSAFSKGVIQGVLTDMLSCLQELVLDGKSVRIGELGLFSIGMVTKPADTAKEFTAQNVTGVHLNLRNTKAWSNAELRKMCRMEELNEYNRGGVGEPTDPITPDTPSEGDGSGEGNL